MSGKSKYPELRSKRDSKSIVTIILPYNGRDAAPSVNVATQYKRVVSNINVRCDFQHDEAKEKICRVVRIRFEIDLDPDSQKLKQVLPGIIKNFRDQLLRYPERRQSQETLEYVEVNQDSIKLEGGYVETFTLKSGAFNVVLVSRECVARVRKQLLVNSEGRVAESASPRSGDTRKEATEIVEFMRCSPARAEMLARQLHDIVVQPIRGWVTLLLDGLEVDTGRQRNVKHDVARFQFIPNAMEVLVDNELEISLIVLRIYARSGRILLDAFSDGNFRKDDNGNVVLVDPDNLDAGYDSDSPGIDDLFGSYGLYIEWWNREYFRNNHEMGTLLISALSMATMLDATFNDDMGTTFWEFVRDQPNFHQSSDDIKKDFIEYLSDIKKSHREVEQFIRSFVIHVGYLRVLLVAKASGITLTIKSGPCGRISDDEKKKTINTVDFSQAKALSAELSSQVRRDMAECPWLFLKPKTARCSERYLSLGGLKATSLWMTMLCQGVCDPHLKVMDSLRKVRSDETCPIYVNPTRDSLKRHVRYQQEGSTPSDSLESDVQNQQKGSTSSSSQKSCHQTKPSRSWSSVFFARFFSLLSIYVVLCMIAQHRVFYKKPYSAFLSNESPGGPFLRG